MNSNYSFSRVDFIKALQEWCKDEYDPLISFPGKDGFQNVAYLYDERFEELIDRGYDLMAFVHSRIGIPVMVFAEHPNKIIDTALTCRDWLRLIT